MAVSDHRRLLFSNQNNNHQLEPTISVIDEKFGSYLKPPVPPSLAICRRHSAHVIVNRSF